MVGAFKDGALLIRVYGVSCACDMVGVEQEVGYFWDGCGGRCEGMGIGEWIAAGGCGVGWKERCGENVLTALVCRGET